MGESLFLSLRSLISKMGTPIPALPASLDEGDEHGSICLLLGTVLCALLHLHRAGDEEGGSNDVDENGKCHKNIDFFTHTLS